MQGDPSSKRDPRDRGDGMSRRERDSSRQLLAVTLAVVMLVSMGGLAFLGGASAQTGGTFNSAVETEQVVNDQVDVANDRGDVSLIGPDDSFDANITDDGSVEIPSDVDIESDEFEGVAVSAERVDTLFDAEADPGTEQADFLTEVVDTYSVSGQNASVAGNNASYPVILIEYDPQSEFSQINGSDAGVDGEHDYLAVVADGSSDVNAYSIDNDNQNATTTLVSGADSFGAVFDTLVGSETADLQNENIDSVTFAAGVGLEDDTEFDESGFEGATISDLRLSDGTEERLINTEKIALNPDGDTEFYSSVTDAVANADAGDTIDVAAGSYGTFEDDTLTIDTGVLITGANSNPVEDRVDTDQDLIGDEETRLNANISVTADDTTLRNVVVSPSEYAGSEHVDIDADGSTLANTIVLQSGTETGINVTSDTGTSTNITNTAVIASSPDTVNDGDTGLALTTQAGEDVTVNNSLFVGHQTQIAGNDNVDETAFLGQFEDNADAQSAVAVNAAGDVQGNAIFGNVTDADAAATDSEDNITVSAGTYNHDGEVPINTTDVTITDTSGTAATISNGFNITAAGSVTVDGFSISSGDLTATTGSPEALTVRDTEVASGIIDVDDVATVSLNGTSATDHQLGLDASLGTVTLTDTYEYTNEVTSFNINATGDVSVTEAAYGGPSGLSTPGLHVNTEGDVSVVDSDVGVMDIGLGVTPSAVNITDSDATNYTIDAEGDVNVDGVTASPPGSTTGINISTGTPDDITVQNSEVTLSGDATGVDVTASGEDGENITVRNVTVAGNGNSGTGVAVDGINTDGETQYTIDANTLEALSNGTGINVAETSESGRNGDISLSENVIQSNGEEFIGMRIDLPEAGDVEMRGNEIVGGNVAGGADSVGIEFVEAPAFRGNFLDTGDDEGATFENNVITGHARLIEDDSTGGPVIAANSYTRMINTSDLGNEMGTLVVGSDGDYDETYGVGDNNADLNIDGNTDDGAVYLPGSIQEAMNLVDANPNINEADLQVYDPGVESTTENSVPSVYDDEAVVYPDVAGVDLSGETEGVTVNTTFTVPDSGTTLANHNITDLTINSDGDAITVNKNNTQSTFRNLDVDADADGSGLIVNADSEDVNVIEVSESSFDVEADGIVLSGGTDGERNADDRDGFVVHDVTVTGDGIGDGATGLDLSQVEKPGKDSLDVSLNVTENDINDFETQVDVGSDLPDSVNASALLDGPNPSVTGVDIADNEFSHAVLVTNASGLSDTNLYGSVNAADDVAADGDTIDVRDVASAETRYNHTQVVTLETANVTLTGPAVADSGAATADDVVIEDQIRATNTTATVEALVVNTENSSAVLNGSEYGANADAGETTQTIVGADANVNLTVQDATVTTTLGSDYDGERPVGIGAATDGSTATLDVNNVYVGGPDSGIGTGVVAQENVALSIVDSDLRAGANGLSTGGDLVSEGYGVLAGPGTAPTISDTQIDGFDADGVNTIATDVELDGGAVINNNAAGADSGVGGVATNDDINSPATEYTITGTNVSANDGVGVTLTGVGLSADRVTVSDNAGAGVDVTGDDVEIDQASTIADNGATGALLEVTNATVTNSNLSANGVGADIEATAVTVDTTELTNNDGDGVVVDAETAALTSNTIQQNADGVAVDLTDGANSTVTRNSLSGNTVGLNITAGAAELTVTGNTLDSTDTAIQNNDDATLDGTLNYFGTERGPVGGAGVTDNVVYDPFLTADKTGNTLAEIAETTEFGHDVVLQSGEFTSVGIPAEAAGDGDFDIEEHLTIEDGNVFVFNKSEEKFERVQADDFNAAEELSPLEAIVVENQENQPGAALIDYTDETDPAQAFQNTYEFQEGLNFVSPQQTGTVDEALFPGGDTDFVAQPFNSGGNLYGATDADQVRDQFVERSADGFSDNFRSGAGDRVVHPHVGYLVTVNEESNEGLQVSERISFPNAPTAATIAERTDGDDTAATNLNSGEAYENLQIAFAEADDGDRIRLGTGILEVDPDGISDELVIDNSNLTVFGAGDGATTIEGGNVTVAGDDNVLTDFQVRGANLNTDGNNNDVSGVSVTSASPGGDVVVDGNNNAFSDVNVETLTITDNADSTDVNRAVVGSFDDSGSGTTTTDVSLAQVVVDDATALREAANGTTSFVNSETTVVVDETIDLGGTTADVTVDGVTIRGAGTVENASTLFDVTATDVTLEDVTLNASANTGVNLDLSAGDSVTISDTTLSVTNGTALDASDTDASIDATIEENAFEADSDDAARYVDDENDVLDLAAIQNENEFPANVVLVEGNSDFALTPTIQGGVDVAESTDGDTVSVSAGTYDESVTIDVEGLTLEGAGADSTTIDAGDTRNNIQADNVTVDGLSVVFENQGIYVESQSDNVTIQNSEFSLPADVESTGYAIRYEGGTSDGEVRNNEFVGITNDQSEEFGNGVIISGPDGHEVVGNTFDGNSIGVNVGSKQPAGELLVSDNTFTSQDDFAVALNHDVSGSPSITVSSNDFDSNPIGVLVLAGGDIDISSNAFTGDSSTVYVDDQVGALTLDDVLNSQSNTFDPAGEVNDGQIAPEGQ